MRYNPKDRLMKLIFAALLISFCSFASATDWESSAQKDMNTESGKAYEKVAAKFSAENTGSIMGACMGSQMSSEFILYFKIRSDGSITEKSSSITTEIPTCFSNKLGALTWPKPPTAPFVFKINMSVTM